MKPPNIKEIAGHDTRRMREFWLTLGVVMLLIALFRSRAVLGEPAAMWRAARAFWVGSVLALGVGAAYPRPFLPLYIAGTVAGMSIGFVIGNLILAVLFFTLFVAIGLVRRRSSPIQRSFDRATPTYWKRYEPVDPKRYYRQY